MRRLLALALLLTAGCHLDSLVKIEYHAAENRPGCQGTLTAPSSRPADHPMTTDEAWELIK